ncbi:MAG: LysR substrate-binding domain-containing protein [Verrucomicrobiales bacterium]
MELRHLKSFLVLAEELHFTSAAKRLRVAQPALSKHIQELEAEMQVTLFERSSRRVLLTAAGVAFRDALQPALEALDEAQLAARRISSRQAGLLRIGFVGSLTHPLLPTLLSEFRELHPAVELVLDEQTPAQQLQRLIDHDLDIAFPGMTDPERRQRFQTETLFEERLFVALPQRHNLASRPRLRLSELKNQPLVITSRHGSPMAQHWLVNMCRQEGFEPEVGFEVDRAATVLHYVAAGLGLAVFPEQISRSGFSGVAFVPVTKTTPRFRYTVAWRSSGLGEAGQLFLDLGRKIAARFADLKS